MVTAKYIVRTATNPNPNIASVQTEIHKYIRVHQDVSWSMKTAWLQNNIRILPIQPPESQESHPWEDPPLLIRNPINKNRHPQEAAKAALASSVQGRLPDNIPPPHYPSIII